MQPGQQRVVDSGSPLLLWGLFFSTQHSALSPPSKLIVVEYYRLIENRCFHFIRDGHPDCPPILFLHGFLGSCHDFERVVSDLQANFCCIRVDLPGHGSTRWTGSYTMEQTAAAIAQFLTDRHIAQANLVGYSMGGRLALYLALHFPERFPGAVIESASPGLQTSAEQQARLQQDTALAERLEADFPQFLAEWYAQPLFASLKQHPGFAKVLEQRAQNHSAELARALRGMSVGRQPSLWDRLPDHRIRCC